MRTFRKIALSFLLVFIIAVSLAYAWTVPRMLTHDASSHPQAVTVGSNIYVVEWQASSDFNFLRSTNDGLTWSNPIQPADTFYGGSLCPCITYTPNGLIHIIWAGQYQGLFRSYIFHQSSNDGGRHWSNRHQVFNSSSINANYPYLANKGDTLFLVVAMNLSWVTFRSFDSGITWHDSTFVDSTEIMSQPPVLLYSQGRLHLIYQRGTSEIGIQICYSRSDDLGLSWTVRTFLSDVRPPYFDNQIPSASADESGRIVASWYSYKYGSMCGISGDILGRISTNNGDSWLPETRLTFTQSGDDSHSLIVEDTIFTIWPDRWPFGCGYPKIEIAASGNWGENWSEPEMITGQERVIELWPTLCISGINSNKFLHCFFGIDDPSGQERDGNYYIRNKPFYSNHVPPPPSEPVISGIRANPTIFNSSTLIIIDNPEGGYAELEIYNLLGQKIWHKTINGREASVTWDAKDMDGNIISSGTYFLRAKMGKNISTTKLMYLK